MRIKHNNTFLLPAESNFGLVANGMAVTLDGNLYLPGQDNTFCQCIFNGGKLLRTSDWNPFTKAKMLPDQKVTSIGWIGNKRVWTAFQYYNVAVNNVPWFGVNDQPTCRVYRTHHENSAYYSCVPPADWCKRKFGTQVVLCGSTFSTGHPDAGVGMTVYGPVLNAIDLKAMQAERLITLDMRDTWPVASHVNSVAFMHNCIVFVGRKGTKKNEWYGEWYESPSGVFPPAGEQDKGWHAPPYEGWIWVFDRENFKLIGEASLKSITQTETVILHAASYPAGKKLYIAESYADHSRDGEFEPRSVIHSVEIVL